jgi:hypothetical protein
LAGCSHFLDYLEPLEAAMARLVEEVEAASESTASVVPVAS